MKASLASARSHFVEVDVRVGSLSGKGGEGKTKKLKGDESEGGKKETRKRRSIAAPPTALSQSSASLSRTGYCGGICRY